MPVCVWEWLASDYLKSVNNATIVRVTVIKENVFYKDDDTNVIGVILNGGERYSSFTSAVRQERRGERGWVSERKRGGKECVCEREECVCVWERDRGRERERENHSKLFAVQHKQECIRTISRCYLSINEAPPHYAVTTRNAYIALHLALHSTSACSRRTWWPSEEWPC